MTINIIQIQQFSFSYIYIPDLQDESLTSTSGTTTEITNASATEGAGSKGMEELSPIVALEIATGCVILTVFVIATALSIYCYCKDSGRRKQPEEQQKHEQPEEQQKHEQPEEQQKHEQPEEQQKHDTIQRRDSQLVYETITDSCSSSSYSSELQKEEPRIVHDEGQRHGESIYETIDSKQDVGVTEFDHNPAYEHAIMVSTGQVTRTGTWDSTHMEMNPAYHTLPLQQ